MVAAASKPILTPEQAKDKELEKAKLKVTALEQYFIQFNKVFSVQLQLNKLATDLVEILDPVGMTKEEVDACMTLIFYVKRKQNENKSKDQILAEIKDM